jgi:hypothetical protein
LSKVSESISTVTIEEERRESRIFRKAIELWPLWLTVAGGIVACIKFYFTVADLAAGQARWQANAEQRRDRTRNEMDEIRLDIRQLQTDVDWLKSKG